MTKKKKILWNSDFSKLLTGFGRNSKAVLKYLYDTGKYEIIEYACAPYLFDDKRLKSVPWKSYGSIPEDPFIRQEIASNPALEVSTRYGGYFIDEIVEKEKPDIYIGVNDFWAFKDFYDKPWWNKVNCALWVTLDSLPIYDDAIQNGHKVKNFWVWSKFAEIEMKSLGFKQVETLHGAFDVSDFYPLDNKAELKKYYNIENNFIFGFVFRNQGRKLIGTLLEGYKIFKNSYKNNAKLLLHTSWSEGWDIPKFIEEFGIDNRDILTSHICANCKKYDIKPFEGEQSNCRFCGGSKCSFTPNGGRGLSEKQMNEVYNLMDFYIHPITSGGLEMPLVESLLAGTPISTVNYSCGEEFCYQEFVTPIRYSTYREMGSQFIKSQPCPYHIAEIMDIATNEDLSQKSKNGREWALKEFDLNIICKKIENWIDSQPFVEYNFSIKKEFNNENYQFNESIQDDEEWAIDLIKNVFGHEESSKNEFVKKIVKSIKSGKNKRVIYKDAIEAAANHNKMKKKSAASNFFKNDSDTNNVCFLSPDSLTDKIIVSEFFKNLCEKENVFLVGTEADQNLFSQYGSFILLPKNNNTNQVDWLRNIKNEDGKKRFKEIYFKSGNELINVKNQ